MIKLIKYCSILIALSFSASVFAVASLSLIGGNNYAFGNKQALTLQFLYTSGWKYGDNFIFFDVTNPHKDITSITGEWVSRLSYSKITGNKVQIGPLSDVLLATLLKVNGLNSRVYGIGLGTNIALPKFSTVATNLFWTHNKNQPGKSTYEVQAIWILPWVINDRLHLRFNGLLDYIGPLGTLKTNVLIEPGLVLDLGQALNTASNKVYLGFQYSYWYHMLGTTTTQSVPEIIFTWNIG